MGNVRWSVMTGTQPNNRSHSWRIAYEKNPVLLYLFSLGGLYKTRVLLRNANATSHQDKQCHILIKRSWHGEQTATLTINKTFLNKTIIIKTFFLKQQLCEQRILRIAYQTIKMQTDKMYLAQMKYT